MKKFCLILFCIFLLNFLGCAGQRVSPESDPRLEPVCGDGPVEEDTAYHLLQTKYYTLDLPKAWLDKYVIELHENSDGGDMLVVWEAESHKTEYGGHLFAIRLVPSSEDYDRFLSYELLASLDTPEGTFYAVALFSDVVPQYSEDTAAAYQEVAKDIHNVLYSIRPKDGIEMAMP